MARKKVKSSKPSKGLSKKAKSAIVKRARSGKNVGKGNWDKVYNDALQRYGSEEIAKKVAGSVLWKNAKKKGVTKKGKIKSKKSKKR